MSERHRGRRGTGQIHDANVDAVGRAVGKRTLTSQLQMRSAGPAAHDPASLLATAQAGVAGTPQSLPHLDVIQRSFGHHDVWGIGAHVGGAAGDASRAIGAEAYATGNSVAFASAPDLHTAAHEAAHVVQQRGGVQLRGGVGEVGDTYEHHADAVADKVVRGESAEALLDVHAPSHASAGPASGPVQGKFTLPPKPKQPGNQQPQQEDPATEVAQVLLAKKAWLAVQDKTALQVLGELPALVLKVKKMLEASTDYGVVDVANEQVLLQFYYRLKLETTGNSQEPAKEEQHAIEEARAETEGWKTYLENVKKVSSDATDKNTFPTILLGRGASAAYMIENGGVPVDPTTLVIGLEQPWRKERGSQGVINHPHNMIDPKHGGGEIDKDDGLASRQEFSNRVDEIMAKLTNSLNATVRTVEKKGEGATAHYVIDTDQGKRYGRRVVAAMGIGKQTAARVDAKSAAENVEVTDDKQQAHKIPRIMNMDVFQQHVASGAFKKEHAPNGIVAVGPNAAIDVMSTGLRNDFKLSWVTGKGRPAFLKGTDNEFVEQEFDKAKNGGGGAFDVIAWDYLGAKADANGVSVECGTREDKRDPKKPVERKVEKLVSASFMVYGLGPDVEGAAKMFPDLAKGAKLEPIYDTGLRFNADPSDVDAVRKAIGDEQKQKAVETILGGLEPITRKADTKNAMFDERLPNQLPTVVGLKAQKTDKDDQSSLEFASGMAFRFAIQQKLAYGYVSSVFADASKDMTAAFPLLETPLAQLELYKPALANLAKLRTAITDKLGALRARVEKVEGGGKDEDLQLDFLKLKLELQQLLTAVIASIEGADQKAGGKNASAHTLYDSVTKLVDTGMARLEPYVEELMSQDRPTGSDQASNQMNLAAKTLPADVLLSDQLTTSRASVEAQNESMPSTVGTKVDFITHDRTVLAAHVASAFPKIPGELANYVVAKIVDDRRHLALDKAPLPRPTGAVDKNTKFNLTQQEDFQKDWIAKLGKLASLF